MTLQKPHAFASGALESGLVLCAESRGGCVGADGGHGAAACPSGLDAPKQFDPDEYRQALAIAAGATQAQAHLQSAAAISSDPSASHHAAASTSTTDISAVLHSYFANWELCTQEQRDYYYQWAPVVFGMNGSSMGTSGLCSTLAVDRRAAFHVARTCPTALMG